MFESRKYKKRDLEGTLHVHVERAILMGGHSDTFVELCLPTLKRRSTTKKTAVVKNTLNPFWTEEFIYKKVTLEDLGNSNLRITVWDHHVLARNKIRGLLNFDKHPEDRHWEEMLRHQGQWVERWHDLRSDHSILYPRRSEVNIRQYQSHKVNELEWSSRYREYQLQALSSLEEVTIIQDT